MRIHFRLLAPLLLIAASCAHEGASDNPDTAQLKAQAKAQLKTRKVPGSGSSAGASGGTSTSPIASDPCAVHAWYADGECDPWCPQGDDDDCAEPIVCPAYAIYLAPDGVCEPGDPCSVLNDPDCADGGGTPGEPPSGGGCVPPDPGTDGDGKCEPESYEEFVSDPDCRQIACPAIAGIPDGKCVAKSACDYVIDPDCGPIAVPPSPPDGGGVACIEIAYPANGKCEAAPGCEYTDPSDCGIACLAIAYPQDGKCEAPAGCEYNDPDCK
jgi:hypothetical protein